jgi:hypothetical protein
MGTRDLGLCEWAAGVCRQKLVSAASGAENPDGRLSLENGAFDLPLQKGRNEVVVALANNFYGWGLEMRMDNLKGIKLANDRSVLGEQKEVSSH